MNRYFPMIQPRQWKRYYSVILMVLSVGMGMVGMVRGQNPTVVLEVSNQGDIAGEIVLELYPDEAPITVENFLTYTDSGFYNGLIFHRVIADFVVQAGGFNIDLVEKPTNDPIINESFNGLANLRGTIAMARTNEPDSATSQFFINLVYNDFLDFQGPENVGYCVFGRVIRGMEVVDAIAATATQSESGFDDVPVVDVIMENVFRTEGLLNGDPNVSAVAALAGESTSIPVEVFNIFDDDPGDPDRLLELTFYFSDDPDFRPGDPEIEPLGQFTQSLNVSQANYNDLGTFTAPGVPGTYYLTMAATDANSPVEFGGLNSWTASVPLEVAPAPPDLVMAEPNETLLQVDAEEEVALSLTMRNIGGTEAAAEIPNDPDDPNNPNGRIGVSLYRSEDPNFVPGGADSVVVDSVSVVSLAAQSDVEITFVFNAPSELGTYYLVAAADDANTVAEFDETNNNSQTIELEVTLDETIEVDQASGVQEFTTVADERLELRYSGVGQGQLRVRYDAAGKVAEVISLTISRSNLASRVSFVNTTTSQNIQMDEVVLGGSLGSLNVEGTVEVLRSAENSWGMILATELGNVGQVETGNYWFFNFRAEQLGSVDQEGVFNARSVNNVDIAGDIRNMQFFQQGSRNRYNEIQVGGVIADSEFFGSGIMQLQVNNQAGEEAAISNSRFDCSGTGGYIGSVVVTRGDVEDSLFAAGNRIGTFEVQNGNVEGCFIATGDNGSRISSVVVREVVTSDPTVNNGNIVDTTIDAGYMVQRVHADGDIDDGSEITVSQTSFGMIDQVSCGGNLAGSVSAGRITRVRVGYDSNGRRLAEDDDFTGSDLSGSVSASFALQEVNVTGVIDGARVGCSFGSISSIFVEDGFVDSQAQARDQVVRLMVGYENGRRGQIVNEQANVSGTISAGYLGRLYYTGVIDDETSLPTRRGPIVDDVQ